MATSVTLKPNAIDISGSTSGTTTLQASAVAGTTTLTLPAATDTLVGKATTDTLTNKTLTGAAMNGTLGATTPSTASVTTLTTSSTVTHSGGTANGVAYLDGSKVLTTGSALVFDGTNLGLGVTPSAWRTANSEKVLQIDTASLYCNAGNDVYLNRNWFLNTSAQAVYLESSWATSYGQIDGKHIWYNSGATAGTAGAQFTFTQAMTLDASGNLGIGTTSPSTRLHLKGASGTTTLRLEPSSSTSIYTQVRGANGDLYLEADPGNAEGSSSMLFTVDGTERARIDSSGNLLVGVTSGISGFRLNVGSSTTTNNSAILRNDGTQTLGFSIAMSGLTSKAISATTDNRVYIFSNADTSTGQYMAANGTSWNATSDERLKENLTPITDAVNKVSTLRAVVGNYISDENKTPTPFLIAQDVQAVLPEAVDSSNENELGLSYTGLVPLLVAAIKEQQVLITTLTARISALESA